MNDHLSSDVDEAGLADVVDALAELLTAGQTESLQEAAERFPQHVERLKEILPAIEAMLELGR